MIGRVLLVSLNKIYNMDCLNGMKSLIKDESIDVVVTSPPYNLGINYSLYNDNKTKNEYLDWLTEILKELSRVLKKDGSLFLNIGCKPSDSIWPLQIANKCSEIFNLQNTIHWIKSIAVSSENTIGHFKPVNSPRYLNNCHEYIFHFTKSGRVKLDKLAIGVEYKDKTNQTRWKSNKKFRDRGNCWFIPYDTITKSRPHPCIFPTRLPEMCIKLHGLSKTDVVLDPFMGIASTALASISLGVNFIGFEIDENYVNIGNERIKETVDKLSQIKTVKGEGEVV